MNFTAYVAGGIFVGVAGTCLAIALNIEHSTTFTVGIWFLVASIDLIFNVSHK